MSRRYVFPSKPISSHPCALRSRAAATVSPSPVTVSTRPPATRTVPSGSREVPGRAQPRLVGVPGRREHRGHGGPARRQYRVARSPVTHGDIAQVRRHAGQHRQQRLGLRISEPAVELEHVERAVGREHDAGVQYPLIGRTPRRQLPQRRLEHPATQLFPQTVGGDAHGAVGAHATRVGPGVAVPQPLVILGGGQQDELVAVRERQHRELLTLEKVLHHHFAARVAERSLREHGAHGTGRVIARGADHGAFAAREPRSLHHERLGVTLDVDEGRVEGGEGAAGGSGDAGPLHHVFRERLGRLDARCRLAGPEHGVARRAQPVGQARRERCLGSDDGVVDVVLSHRPD